ncbi:MAG: MgtC/SapB family protein [Methylococcaceae bacterium]|nr:MgtC/SapB family protein [Methylococcaceae bacterium]
MTELEKFKLLAVALAIGLLIGLERGWRTRDRGEGLRIAGLRTYGLISVMGGLCALLAKQTGIWFMGIAFLALTLVLLVAYSKSLDKFEDLSITSLIASMITFILGALTVFGNITLTSASAVVITSLLGFKPLLHHWMNKLEEYELNATLKLLLISVVMLPILPDQGFGPWSVFNPYQIWVMVVLIAGVSYLGYFAIKIVGNRHGPILTGALGGLVSSTAVTINLSQLAKQCPSSENALSAGILTACATMFFRTLLLSSVINPEFFTLLLPALLVMSGVTYLSAFLLWRKAPEFRVDNDMALENPFQLGMALKFGVFLLAVLFLSKLLSIYYGNMGAYVLAAASGLADVDPITLTMSRMAQQGLDINVAVNAILIAVSINSGFKSLISLTVGGRALGLRVTSTLVFAVTAGFVQFSMTYS